MVRRNATYAYTTTTTIAYTTAYKNQYTTKLYVSLRTWAGSL